jgi:hypothetical protein
LIAEGLGLRERGQDLEALARFERAYELRAVPRTMAQRGLAEQALGRWLDAELHLESALETKNDAWIKQHRRTLETSLASVRSRLGTIQVQGGQPGAEVRLEGKLVGRVPLAAPLRAIAGQVTLEVSLDGYYPVRREVAVTGGSISTETIELVAAPAPAPMAAPAGLPEPPPTQLVAAVPVPQSSAADGGSVRRLPAWVFWTGLGASAVLGGVTIWSGLNTVVLRDEYVTYSERPRAELAQARLGFDRAHSAQTRTNVLLASTLVVAAATALLGAVFVDFSAESGERAGSERGPAARPFAAVRMGEGAELGLVQSF